MNHITLGAAALGTLLLVTLLALWLRRRRRSRSATTSQEQPRSLVRLLQSTEELDEAVRRAAQFEEVVEQGLLNRKRHYAEILRHVPPRLPIEQGVLPLKAFPALDISPSEVPRTSVQATDRPA